MNQENLDARPKKNPRFHWLMWWKVSPEELNKQISEYNTLRLYQSARGLAALMLVFSAALTVLLGYFNSNIQDSLPDIIIFLVLGLFIFLGFKWANIIAMFVWTVEKIYQIYGLIETGTNGGMTVSVLIWWTAFMQIFYLSFLVEKRRNKSKLAVMKEDIPPETGKPINTQ